MKKLLKNKKGISTIIFAFGITILLSVIYFGTDILKIGNGFSVASQSATEITRIASVQGGIGNSKPSHYPGHYITMSDLDSIVEDKMNAVGYTKEQYAIEINPINGGGKSGKLGAEGMSATGNFDYKTEFEVIIVLNYQWFFSNMTLGIEKDRYIPIRRVGMSEWKFDYGSWVGE